MTVTSDKVIREVVMLPIELLHPNEWNPNEEPAHTFDTLVEEIKTDGFKDPLTVVPDFAEEFGEGHYIIIGGEHRYRAAKVLSYEQLPCYIEDSWTEEEAKLKTVKLNLLRGELNPAKFTKLVHDLEHRYDFQQLPDLFGFFSLKDMAKFMLEDKSKKEKTFLDGLMEEARKEKFAVDSLTDIVATIFSTSAATLDQDYLFFTYKGKTHLVVLCDKTVFDTVKKVVQYLETSGESINEFVGNALKNELGR